MLVQIDGMTCSSCVNGIEKQLLSKPGVQSANVSLVTSKAKIVFDPAEIGPRDLIEIIEVFAVCVSSFEFVDRDVRLQELGFECKLATKEFADGNIEHKKEIRKYKYTISTTPIA